MAPKEKKTKEQIAKAAMAGGQKGKKKKWSKAKSKEKQSLEVMMNADLYKRCQSEIPKQRVITISNVAEKLKVNAALAKQVIRHLHSKGLIREVVKHSTNLIYTRNAGMKDEEEVPQKKGQQQKQVVVEDDE